MFRAALRLATPAAIALTAIVAAACVAPAGATNPSASPSAAIDPDSVVIRVDWEGGFVPPGVNLSRLPIVLVTADGRVITQGPQDAMYPGPLLPNLQVRTLTPEALADLLERAAEDGLLVDAEYAGGPIADAATTVLRITVDGVTYTQSAYALFESLDANGMEQPSGAPDAEGRAAMRSFLDALTGLPDDAYTGASAPYVADGLRLYSSEYVPGSGCRLAAGRVAARGPGDGRRERRRRPRHPLPGGHGRRPRDGAAAARGTRTARRRSAPAARTTR